VATWSKNGLLMIAGIFFSVFNFVTILEAETMKTEGLKAKQKKIIPIAAFTANGDMEKLKTTLHEGLDPGLTVNEIRAFSKKGGR
jgi:alkylhydroperoxidase/carboxymuconolactone decarboxylase family protein YurZ